jgi:DNA-binding response OmpR family regulator
LKESGWSVVEAENRTDGLPLLYVAHPDTVFIEVITGSNESWDLLRSIRLFTSIPVIVLAEQSINTNVAATENIESVMLAKPVSTDWVVAIAKEMAEFSDISTSSAGRNTKGRTFVVALRGLTENEAQEIDQILRQICDGDDVRFILEGNRTRRFAKHPKGAPNGSLGSY